jgi:FkbM family methyltransferase
MAFQSNFQILLLIINLSMLITKFVKLFPAQVRESLIHVGAHAGYEAKTYEDTGFKKILWIEADPDIFETLQQYLAQFQTARHQAVNALVTASSNQKRKFYRYSNEGASNSLYLPTSIFRDIFCEVAETGESLTLPTISLDDLATQQDIQPTALVIDVQGAELEVLSGGKETLQATCIIDIEVSKQEIYEGGALFYDIEEFLKTLGFVRLTYAPWHGDVVYIKPQGISPLRYFFIKLMATHYNGTEYLYKIIRLCIESITRPAYTFRKLRIRFGSLSKNETISPS